MNSKRGYTIWSALLLEYCFADNCTGRFNDFISIARATMHMCAKSLGRSLDDTQVTEVLEQLRHLALQDGVQEGLSNLYDQGFRIAALTNSPRKIVLDRMERTGLISYFEAVLSAEQVKKFKPCTEVYEWAAAKLDVDPAETLLVTAHGWELAGGASAGMKTAYLKKNRQMLYPLAPEPDLVCSSLEDLASQMEKMEWVEGTV